MIGVGITLGDKGGDSGRFGGGTMTSEEGIMSRCGRHCDLMDCDR